MLQAPSVRRRHPGAGCRQRRGGCGSRGAGGVGRCFPPDCRSCRLIAWWGQHTPPARAAAVLRGTQTGAVGHRIGG